MSKILLTLSLVLFTACSSTALSNPSEDKLPVKEITVFKDGHSFVLHEGIVATDDEGNVVLDRLPRPVVGTFWAYARQAGAELTSVVAGKREVSVDHPALDIAELLEANPGKRVRIRESDGEYIGTIRAIPKRDTDSDEAPVKGSVVVLETDEGQRVVPKSNIRGITFLDEPSLSLASAESRDSMRLHLRWEKGKSQPKARVGITYLERGIRWIPSYRVVIDGANKAHVELQATLINEMIDLKGVTAHLVVGAPTFAFRETVDPISLQQTVVQLSSHFQEGSQTANAFSNALRTQMPRMQEVRGSSPQPASGDSMNLGPEIGAAGKAEDMFVFQVENVTLRKGERMVVPIAKFDLEYRDLYTLSLPMMPPVEVRRSFNSQQQAELTRSLHRPSFMHKLRLTNSSRFPLTTAPALIFNGTRLIAQGMMTYTAIGGVSDLELTKAIDLRMNHTVRESKRTPNALRVDGDHFVRVDLTGSIRVTNHLGKPVEIEIARHVLGNLDEADRDGIINSLDVWEESLEESTDGYSYPWMNWYAWPWWWRQVNGRGLATWKLELQPQENVELHYGWHYFWR